MYEYRVSLNKCKAIIYRLVVHVTVRLFVILGNHFQPSYFFSFAEFCTVLAVTLSADVQNSNEHLPLASPSRILKIVIALAGGGSEARGS
jgi:hypothetical protein